MTFPAAQPDCQSLPEAEVAGATRVPEAEAFSAGGAPSTDAPAWLVVTPERWIAAFVGSCARFGVDEVVRRPRAGECHDCAVI